MKKLIIIATLLFAGTLEAAVTVENAWVRLLPPTVKTTAAYMVIKSDTNDKIIAASSPASNMVEMHQSLMADGVMSMEQLPEIHLPANQAVELKPHGLHLMVMGLTAPLSEGQEIEIKLQLQTAGEVIIKAKVEKH